MTAWLTSLGGALSLFFGRKAFTITGYTVAFSGLVTAYIACITAIQQMVTALEVTLPTSSPISGGSSVDWLGVIAMFVPSNLANCVSAIVASVICRMAFTLTRDYLSNVAQSS